MHAVKIIVRLLFKDNGISPVRRITERFSVLPPWHAYDLAGFPVGQHNLLFCFGINTVIQFRYIYGAGGQEGKPVIGKQAEHGKTVYIKTVLCVRIIGISPRITCRLHRIIVSARKVFPDLLRKQGVQILFVVHLPRGTVLLRSVTVRRFFQPHYAGE